MRQITPADVAPSVSYEPNQNGVLRPYETSMQKDVEYSNVQDFMCWMYGPNIHIKALSKFESIDYSIHPMRGKYPDSQLIALVEAKSHSKNYNPSHNYILNLKNWKAMLDAYLYCPVYLLAGFDGVLYWWQFDPRVPHSLHAGGRKDRNDPNDIVLKINFSCSVFQPVGQ